MGTWIKTEEQARLLRDANAGLDIVHKQLRSKDMPGTVEEWDACKDCADTGGVSDGMTFQPGDQELHDLYMAAAQQEIDEEETQEEIDEYFSAISAHEITTWMESE